MISTDDRSPSGRDNTTRLTFNNNNNEVQNSLYYQYVPASTSNSPPATPSSSTPPHSPLLQHRHSLSHNIPQHHRSAQELSYYHSQPQLNNNHQHQQIVLRDPTLLQHHQFHQSSSTTSGTVALPASNSRLTSSNGGIAEFLQNHLSSRIIPKLGSIVKRFSLNYSGEGLVTDRQRTRTVRVGIRFQVQVDSFVNNRQLQDNNTQQRAIVRTQSAPSVDQLDSGFSSPTSDSIFPTNNRQLALEYSKHNSLSTSSPSISNSTSASSVAEYCCGASTSGASSTKRFSCADSSSGVSSEASSPVLTRRPQHLEGEDDQDDHYHYQNHHHPEEKSSSTLAFHNRINQALNSYRNQQQLITSPSHHQHHRQLRVGSPPSADSSYLNRRASVQVYRRGSSTPPERPGSGYFPEQQQQQQARMEDSSSYQVLRHFPGSNVNSLNELSWETAAFEKEIRDRIQWIGDKVSSLRIPRIISHLMDFGRDYARENPVTAMILLALCLTSSAPVLIFLVFAIATILVTFLGFLFVEGTLLTVATVIFGGVIAIVGFVTLTAVLLGMLGYFTTSQAYLLLTGQSRIYTLLRKIPIIGRIFPKPTPPESYYNSNKEERREFERERDHDDQDEDEVHLNKSYANGKVPNGYHAQGHTSSKYQVGCDDDDGVDIIDSDVDDDDEIEDDDIEADNNVTLNGHSHSGDGDSSDVVEEDADHDDNDDDEDLGNQEIVSGVHKAENNSPQVNGNASEPEEEEEEKTQDKRSNSPIMLNGHHHDDDYEDDEIHHDHHDKKAKKQKQAENSESAA